MVRNDYQPKKNPQTILLNESDLFAVVVCIEYILFGIYRSRPGYANQFGYIPNERHGAPRKAILTHSWCDLDII